MINANQIKINIDSTRNISVHSNTSSLYETHSNFTTALSRASGMEVSMPGRGCLGYLDLRGAEDLGWSVVRASLKAGDDRLSGMADIMEQYIGRLSTLLHGSCLSHEATNRVLHELRFGKGVVMLRQGRAEDVKFGDMFDTGDPDLKGRSVTDPDAWTGETEIILRQRTDSFAEIFLTVVRTGNLLLVNNLRRVTVEDEFRGNRPFPFLNYIRWEAFKTVLRDAFAERRSELIKALIELGTRNWNTFFMTVGRDKDEPAVLDMAVESGDVGIVRLILERLRASVHCYDEAAERSRFPGAEFDAVRGKPLDLLEALVNRGDKETARSLLQRFQLPVLIQALEQQPEDQIQFGQIKSRLWDLALACDGAEYVREGLRAQMRSDRDNCRGIETISKYVGWNNDDDSRLARLILEACRKKETQVVCRLLRSAPSSLMTADEDLRPLFRMALDLEDQSIRKLLRLHVVNMLDMVVFNKNRVLVAARALDSVENLIIDALCQNKPFMEISRSLGYHWGANGESFKQSARLLAVAFRGICRLDLEADRRSTRTLVQEPSARERILAAFGDFLQTFMPARRFRGSVEEIVVTLANSTAFENSVKELELTFPYESDLIGVQALPSDALTYTIRNEIQSHLG